MNVLIVLVSERSTKCLLQFFLSTKHLRHRTDFPYQLIFFYMYIMTNFALSIVVLIETISNKCCYVCDESTSADSILI